MKRLLWVLAITMIITAPLPAYCAERVLSYGFEDWTGSADTTPGYIFGTEYSSYWDLHKSATEVVAAAGSWKPHSGRYFFYRQHESMSDPILNGGTGTINDHGCVGQAYQYGNGTTFRCSQLGKQLFIKFWFITNSGYLDFSAYANKFVRIYTDKESVYAHTGGTGKIYQVQEVPSINWGTGISFPGGNPINDGQWHSFAMFIDLTGNGSSQGVTKIWLDTDESLPPTWQSTTRNWGGATRFDHICLQQNFSANDPIRSTAVGVDDIEIWNGMPTPGTVTNVQEPAAPKSVSATVIP